MSCKNSSYYPPVPHGPRYKPNAAVAWPMTCFMTPCDTCGRRLQVGVNQLGAEVACPHCGGRFRAVEADASQSLDDEPLLARADRLLETVESAHH
ncbi:hypothetical protein Mal64_07360 [Pseudobythopirellula maris]|uniref:Uncharacterized protein n=1 Tax=Pseudobythopirellula maris TaxID=2527991 RepID=A0A5C5ZTG4_9BACT|nr:hypothetical protein [Pseudobythopirellula maris]TWT90347.1 hypothetical protein Mal64_07360 [Pseudobythopirellula maris]